MAMESAATLIVGGAFISLTAVKAFLTASNSILVLLVSAWCCSSSLLDKFTIAENDKTQPCSVGGRVKGAVSGYKDRVTTTDDVRNA